MRSSLVCTIGLLAALTFHAQHPASPTVPASEIDAARKLDRAAVAARREEVYSLLGRLQKQFDDSIHSDRNSPEQRKVQYDTAALEAGLHLGRTYADATGDRRPLDLFRARETRIQGTVLLNQRRYAAAVEKLTAALAEAERLDDVWLQVITRTNIAYGELELGHPGRALSESQRADALAARLDVRSHALTMFDLADLYMHRGEFEPAVTYGVQAVALARQCGNRMWQGNALLNLGVAYHQLHRNDEARAAYREAREVLLKTQDQLGIGRVHYDLALLDAEFGDYMSASAGMERALPLIRSVDIRHSHEIEPASQGPRANPVEVEALALLVKWFGAIGDSGKVRQYTAELQTARAALARQPHEAGGHEHHHQGLD